jgi:hypothetical protein
MNPRKRADGFHINPITTAYLIAFGVLAVETALFAITSMLMTNNVNGAFITQLLAVILTIANSIGAYIMSLKAMNTYEPHDESRKVWRFIMFAMFMLSVGNIITFLLKYILMDINLKPPTIADWIGYIWVFPCLLIALVRKYNLVKTVGKPNSIMMFLPVVLAIFVMMCILLSPFVSQILFNLQLRLMALAIIAFTSAMLIYALSILSEIYTGILSRSWKTIIAGIFVFAVYYVGYYFILSNNIFAGVKIIDNLIMPTLAQTLPIMIALAAHFEMEIIG